MSAKGIAAAVAASAAVLGGLALVLYQRGGAPVAPPAPSTRPPAVARQAADEGARGAGVGRAPSTRRAAPPPAEEPQEESAGGETPSPEERATDAGSREPLPPSAPAGPEALAAREAFRQLKGKYGE